MLDSNDSPGQCSTHTHKPGTFQVLKSLRSRHTHTHTRAHAHASTHAQTRSTRTDLEGGGPELADAVAPEVEVLGAEREATRHGPQKLLIAEHLKRTADTKVTRRLRPEGARFHAVDVTTLQPTLADIGPALGPSLLAGRGEGGGSGKGTTSGDPR